MTHEVVPYGGWEECVRLTNGTVELIVTTQVGPRIIRYGFCDGPNEFVEYADQMGKRGEDRYRSYGGHRLWVAPETEGWTNHPDNHPVEVSHGPDGVVFSARPEAGTGLQKSIAISLAPTGTSVRVRHTVRNTTEQDITCALWALSVMAPGGSAIVPQERHIPHADKVLPARPMVLWHYVDMTDPRWTWGARYIRLSQSAERSDPQKFGVQTTDGWTAYWRQDHLFLKRFPFQPDATYPDFGCNAEIFTNSKMLEVESLGPLGPLGPGLSRDHAETWELHRPGPLPADEKQMDRLLSSLSDSG